MNVFLAVFVAAAVLTALAALILISTTASSSGHEGRTDEEARSHDGLLPVRVHSDHRR
jgi:hypothetical protein